jgi:hypothetical protein
MATLKNPSIYDDRGTIGSADELDAYGVWVKIEPEELSDADSDPFPDFDADFGPELSLDETAEDAFGDFDYSDGGLDSNFDDVEALRQDIQSAPPAAPAQASTDLSTQLLMKIADELASIKKELSSLKEELSVIRSEKPGKRSGEGAEEGGFFNEEDDGKIALTGDELNNIIHTADFTEETGADAGDFVPMEPLTKVTAEATAEALAKATAEPRAEITAETLAEATAEVTAETLAETTTETPEPAAFDDGVEALDGPPLETADFDGGEEIIYDGLGRPLNRKIPGDEDIDLSLELEDSDDLKALRENGVDPMTDPPEDTSYLEEDAFADALAEDALAEDALAEDALTEDSLDLSDAVIDEPDLSEGVRDAPLEEPALEDLPLIDLNVMESSGEIPETGEDKADEKLFLEDITFEDLPDFEIPADLENPADFSNPQESAIPNSSSPAKADEEESIDLSIFEDDLSTEDGDLSFEVLDEDADLPAQENLQNNVITEDSFESISLDDEDADEVTEDQDLDQILPGNTNLAAGTVSPAARMDLKDVLIYMDKLLESLPEEKIDEFAHSEHYNTYKKLFEELGIPQ